MVRKEDLCDWFRNLDPTHRLDYLCGLLHICLPLELRFVGSVLEDLAKKDYLYLRDKEIKANTYHDVDKNQSNSLADPCLRAKFLLTLALMKSSNFQCAEVVYRILKSAENQFHNLSGSILHNKQATDEIELILMMAVHHPAFKFSQKQEIGQIQKHFQDSIDELSLHPRKVGYSLLLTIG